MRRSTAPATRSTTRSRGTGRRTCSSGSTAPTRSTGGAGNDTLIGGLGPDSLTPGAGLDLIRFLSPGEGGDSVFGYVVSNASASNDTIEVSAAGFGGGLFAGINLGATGRYVENGTGAATSAVGVGQFVFNTITATLLWDADGTGGGAAVDIAAFSGLVTLGASEIVVIA